MTDARAEETDLYTLNMLIMPDRQAVQVNQTVTYHNDTGRKLTSVVFCVYANVFRRETTLPYDNATLEAAFPNGYAPGGITLYSVMVDGVDADWGVQGQNECFLRVACDLDDGDACVFSFAYYLLLTDNRAFLGCADGEMRLTEFYPVACVFQYEEFQTPNASAVGRFDYHEEADYQVTLLCPEGYAPACGGACAPIQTENGYCQYEISLKSARNFALALRRGYRSFEAKAKSGAVVTVYGADADKLNAVLQTAVNALDVFEEWFGAYPRAALSLAKVEYARDGMTNTGLILLGDALFDDGDELLYRVVWFVCQQFFGETVYTDPVREPWLSDALCEYLTLLYFEQTQGHDALIRLLNKRILPALQLTIPGGLTVDSYATRFTTLADYEIVVRNRGAAVLNELRVSMGRDALLSALRLYYQNYARTVASIADFAGALNAATGGSWDDALINWLYTVDDYASEILEYYE